MIKKYEFTGKTKEVYIKETEAVKGMMATVENKTTIVRQIRAISTFVCGTSEIEAGTLGGWISSEMNLPQESCSWLDETSIVCNEAKLDSNSRLYSSTIQGDIVVKNSIIKDSDIYHVDFNEESGFIQDSKIVRSSLESSLLIQNASFDNLKSRNPFGFSGCKLNVSGKITLSKMSYQNLTLKGTAVLSACTQVGKMTGHIKGGMLRDVTLSGSITMNGMFHCQDSDFRNVHFTGGDHHIKDSTILFKNPANFTGKSKWRDVNIRSEFGRIEADSELECVRGNAIGMLKVKAPLVMKNVKLEKGTRFEVHKMSKNTVEVIGGRKSKMTTRARISGKSNASDYGIVIDSPLLDLLDCQIHGFVQIKGYWCLRQSKLIDYASIKANGKRNKLAYSFLKDISSINKISNEPYSGKRLQLINDNEIII